MNSRLKLFEPVAPARAIIARNIFSSGRPRKKKSSFHKFRNAKKSKWDEIPPSKSSDKTRKWDATNTEDSSDHHSTPDTNYHSNNDNLFAITWKKRRKHSRECCDFTVELINYDGELIASRGLLDSGCSRSVLLKPFVQRKQLKQEEADHIPNIWWLLHGQENSSSGFLDAGVLQHKESPMVILCGWSLHSKNSSLWLDHWYISIVRASARSVF